MKRAVVRSILFGIAAFIGMGASAPAAVIFDLNRVLSDGNFTSSPSSQSLGTVTISNITGGVKVAVQTIFDQDFSNLMLNIADGPIVVLPPTGDDRDSFTFSGYLGKFDLGYYGDYSDGASFNLYGFGLTENSFLAKDTKNQVYVAVKIDDLKCPVTGCVEDNNPKWWERKDVVAGGTLQGQNAGTETPEPGTMALISLGLIGFGFARFRRR